MKLDPFYLIVDSVSWLERLLPHGVKLVQLRMKEARRNEVRSHITRAKALCEAYNCQLIVNDYWDLAIEEQCTFIHLGQEDLATADLTAIGKAGLKLGVSSHDLDELKIALTIKPDYIALGPIYPTKLKKMPWAPQGIEKLRIWKEKMGSIPLVAIGGLTPVLATKALEAGADSAAAITDILMDDNPQARVKEWINATQKWRKAQ